MVRVDSVLERAGSGIQGAGKKLADQGSQAVEEVAAHPWTQTLARLGLMARGIIYGTVGWLAAKAALGYGGETTDTHGAIETLGQQPLGVVLLAVLGVGLVGYAVWRILEAVADLNYKGKSAKGLAVRAGYIGSGLIHFGLALGAFRLLAGIGTQGGDKTREGTAKLMEQPFGKWLVVLVGVGVIGYGLWQFWIVYKARFRRHFDLSKMSAAQDRWATRFGRFGYAARGIVFGLIGTFLIYAGLHSNPNEAKGLEGALDTLARQPHGPWLLGLVAFGLVAYGLESLMAARFRRLGKPD